MAMCIGAPAELVRSIIASAKAAIEAVSDPAEKATHLKTVRSFVLNAAKTATFMLELELLKVCLRPLHACRMWVSKWLCSGRDGGRPQNDSTASVRDCTRQRNNDH
jgi:hypothetical protein